MARNALDAPLALAGGPPVLTEPLPTGSAALSLMDEAEVEAAARIIRSRALFRFADHEHSECTLFEREACAFLQAPYGLIVNSGTNALIACLVGLGVGPGDEVLVPAYTYIATPVAVTAVGAVPVIVEIDDSLGMDPADAAVKITPHTRAIMPVHMQGVPCRLQALVELAEERGLHLIEDCCQAVGARYHGQPVGTFGAAGAWSLNYYKVITCGEGGFAFCHDFGVYERMCFCGEPGLPMWMKDNYGENYGWTQEPFGYLGLRSNEISAAIARVQLSKMETALGRCRLVKAAVRAELDPEPRLYRLQHQDDPTGDCGISMALICRDQATAQRFGEALAAEGLGGIGCAHRDGFPDRHVYRYWDSILHKRSWHPAANPWTHPAYRGSVEYSEDMCPRTMDLLDRTLRLRLNVNLTPAHGRLIATAINKVDRLLER